MTRFADKKRLLRVAEATKAEIDRWGEGVSLQADTGHTIEELRHRATADRFALAVRFYQRGRDLALSTPPSNRDAISRLYYSMYHCWRALIFFSHGGDDFQSHSNLQKKEPPAFPNAPIWRNRLNNARLRRNEADYEAYPKSDPPLAAIATSLELEAQELIRVSRTYLRSRGCQYV